MIEAGTFQDWRALVFEDILRKCSGEGRRREWCGVREEEEEVEIDKGVAGFVCKKCYN